MRIHDRMEYYGVPGLSLCVVNDNEVLYSKGYGIKSKGSNDEVYKKTKFNTGEFGYFLGLITSLYLFEEGKISYDEPVFKTYKYIDNNFATLREILSGSVHITIKNQELNNEIYFTKTEKNSSFLGSTLLLEKIITKALETEKTDIPTKINEIMISRINMENSEFMTPTKDFCNGHINGNPMKELSKNPGTLLNFWSNSEDLGYLFAELLRSKIGVANR
jgi:hypothetical protein